MAADPTGPSKGARRGLDSDSGGPGGEFVPKGGRLGVRAGRDPRRLLGRRQGALRTEANRADAGSLRVEGDRGFLIYRGVEKTVFAIPMAREDRGWKVAAATIHPPCPLPPTTP